jgi:hypothetical protein
MHAPSVVLTAEQRTTIEKVGRAATSAQRDVLRANVVLLAAENVSNIEIGRRLGIDRKTAGKWRSRFDLFGLEGLKDAPRSGRPPMADVVVRCQVIAVACSLAKQAEDGKPEAAKQALDNLINKLAKKGALDEQAHSQVTAAADTIYEASAQLRGPRPEEESCARTTWTYASLAQAVAEAEIAELSKSTIWRILEQSEIKPHRHKMWLHSLDPDFKAKVTEICQLYLHPPKDASVICVDEKSGMQILRRINTGRAAAPGQTAREEYEYERLGTKCLFAAFDVQTGRVFGRLRDGRTAWDTHCFMEELATQWLPEGQVHVIWDNLNTHAKSSWQEFNRDHGERFHFHYTPVHASWVNQVECFFSIFARRVLKRSSFSCREDFVWKAQTFMTHWNQYEAHPFRWVFSGYPPQIELASQQAA